MNFDKVYSTAEYIAILETPPDPSASPEARERIQSELAAAQSAQTAGVLKVKLTFRRNSVNRQWIR